jgi:hypothetical protein
MASMLAPKRIVPPALHKVRLTLMFRPSPKLLASFLH